MTRSDSAWLQALVARPASARRALLGRLPRTAGTQASACSVNFPDHFTAKPGARLRPGSVYLQTSKNFNLDGTHQAGQDKERNTGEHREPQADVQQGCETPPHKPGPPGGQGEGLARALEVQRPAKRGSAAGNVCSRFCLLAFWFSVGYWAFSAGSYRIPVSKP